VPDLAYDHQEMCQIAYSANRLSGVWSGTNSGSTLGACDRNTNNRRRTRRASVTSRPGMATDQPMVATFDGDQVVREALEVLLQAAGYRARSLPESVTDELGELLADSQLLIVAPALSTKRWQALLDVALSPKASVKIIPILELLPVNGEEEQHFRGHVVLWPCSVEELKQAIETVLAAQR
jgi:hypothetical protein